MAKSDNPLLKGVRGNFCGAFIVKQYSYGTVISKMPYFPKQEKTGKQELRMNAFKEAVAYAQGIVHDKKKKAAYAKKIPKGKRVYNAAIQEFMQQTEWYKRTHSK
jgi:hypothetical protein